jgi:MFS family permease
MTASSVRAPGPLSTPTRGSSALLVASGAAFLAFLDLSVVNIAFPSLARDHPATSLTTLTWVVSGYAVAFAALLTPGGRIADAVGRRTVFLITARVAQGTTAALMVPSALGALLAVTPRARIGGAIAAWSAAGGFAAVVGPALGGALVELFGWRSIFVINVPIALALAGLAFRILEPDTEQTRGALPDPVGTVMVASGLGGLVAGLTEGQRWGWTAPGTLGALGLGALLTLAALRRSLRHPNPALAVDLWRNRSFALANAASFAFGAAMFAWLLAGPMFLDEMWGYSVLGSAAALSVGAVASMVTAALTGRITAPGPRRWTGVLGVLMFLATLAWMSTGMFGPTPALWSAWIPAGILGGGGVGIVVTVLGATAANALPPHRFAAGTGMNLTARQLGGALGIAVLAAVLAAHPGDPLAGFHTLFLLCAGFAAVSACLIAVPSREESR